MNEKVNYKNLCQLHELKRPPAGTGRNYTNRYEQHSCNAKNSNNQTTFHGFFALKGQFNSAQWYLSAFSGGTPWVKSNIEHSEP